MHGVELYKNGCYWKIWCNGCITFKSRSKKRAVAEYEKYNAAEFNKVAHEENQRLLNNNMLD